MRANPNKMAKRNKQIEVAKVQMCDKATELMLVLAYSCLVERFKFDAEKVNKFRWYLDQYAGLMADGCLDIADIRESLLRQGIDTKKIVGKIGGK